MQIVKHQELFELVDGVPQFKCTKLLLSENGSFLSGKSTSRTSSSEDLLGNVQDVRVIPTEDYQPEYSPRFTRAPPDQAFFVKRPNLMDYTGDSQIAARLLREIGICEILRSEPQSNIAHYEGCRVSDGRIQGICFSKYPVCLMEKVNPGHLNKHHFAQACSVPRDTVDGYISGIRAGLQHLHSLGYVHNDINPNNIMLAEDGAPIIIDFDSCTRVGQPLKGIRRTYGWYDERVQTAAFSNDMQALEEMRSWLSGDASHFIF